MFDYSGMGHGFFMPGMMFFWLILAVIIIGFFMSGRTGCRHSGGESSSASPSALDDAKRRYAKGEISEEEFDRIKAKIA